jgi:23S rRNA (cytosine1962-C5)-methyltransferase
MSATVVLQTGREKSLLRHHPWVFASAIKSTQGRLHSGDTVIVLSAEGKILGLGAWSPESTIRVRMWSFSADEVIDNAFFLRRIQHALTARQLIKQNTDAFRLVAAENDGLPGVTIDLYPGLLVCQLLSAGAEKHRDKIVWALRKLFPSHSILERSDVAIRKREGLEPIRQILYGEIPEEICITELGAKFLVSPLEGHKTGFYLDQRSSRALVASFARDKEVLNCFSYTGGFTVHCLLQGAKHVTSVDSSGPALSLLQRQLALNNLPTELSTTLNADVFAQLRQWRQQGRLFDLIILDPPKFAESKQQVTRACRGYKDINMLALQLLRPGGFLATFSCSGLLSEDLFRKVVADAALDANRQLLYLQRMAQDQDHPVAASYPEGFYLKGLLAKCE